MVRQLSGSPQGDPQTSGSPPAVVRNWSGSDQEVIKNALFKHSADVKNIHTKSKQFRNSNPISFRFCSYVVWIFVFWGCLYFWEQNGWAIIYGPKYTKSTCSYMTVAHFATVVAIDCGPIDGKWFNDIPIVRLSPDQPASYQLGTRVPAAPACLPRAGQLTASRPSIMAP